VAGASVGEPGIPARSERPVVRNAPTKRFPRRVGIVAGFLALAALPAVGVGAFAAAATGSGEASAEGTTLRRPQVTDAQKQCLTDHGVTLPATGERPQGLTDEQRAAFRAAAQACGISLPAHGPRLGLSDAQKQCLTDQGVTLPVRPANGERPTPPTDEQRAAFRAAAQACGITLPAFGAHRGDQGGTSI
jgi:hypothetical protein